MRWSPSLARCPAASWPGGCRGGSGRWATGAGHLRLLLYPTAGCRRRAGEPPGPGRWPAAADDSAMLLPGPLDSPAARDNPVGSVRRSPACCASSRWPGGSSSGRPGGERGRARRPGGCAAPPGSFSPAANHDDGARGRACLRRGAAGPDRLSDVLIAPVFALIPAAVGFAILRRRLYDLDLVVNPHAGLRHARRAARARYAAVLALAGSTSTGGLGGRRWPWWPVMLMPLRAGCSDLADRLVNGDRGEPVRRGVQAELDPAGRGGAGRPGESVAREIAGSLKLRT